MINLTNRKYLELAFLALILLGITALGAHPYLGRSQSFAAVTSSAITNDKRYSTDLKELRARFNRDKGKVRMLLLLSPT
jgi:DNA-binding helix-hairpin-helix protein with protein kinase domain